MLAELPAWTDTVVGLALAVKSGMDDGETGTLLEADPVWLAESATVRVTVKLPDVE